MDAEVPARNGVGGSVGRASERAPTGVCHRYHVYPSVAHGLVARYRRSGIKRRSRRCGECPCLDRSGHGDGGFRPLRPVWQAVQGRLSRLVAEFKAGTAGLYWQTPAHPPPSPLLPLRVSLQGTKAHSAVLSAAATRFLHVLTSFCTINILLLPPLFVFAPCSCPPLLLLLLYSRHYHHPRSLTLPPASRPPQALLLGGNG